jgi:small subunit ribosomal protein S1
MNNEQTHTDDSTVDVEEEQSVGNSTEVTHDEGNETETEVETTSDNAETEHAESPVDEPAQIDQTDDSVQTAESEEAAESDPSEAEAEEVDQTADAESEEVDQTDESESATSEGEPHETTPTAESETPETESDAVTVTAEPESDTVAEQATPMSQESLEEAYDNSLKAFTDGEIVKGTVVDVSRDEVMIDIGFKSEGYIPASEFDSAENDLPSVQVGDEIDVYIVRREDSEGQIVLSKKIADQTLVWDEITEAYESGSPVEGRITERIKGGLRVTVGSLRGFLPASQVELRPIQNLDQYIGEVFQMKVISMSKRRHNIVLSRRAWLEAEMAEKKEEVLKTLEVGQHITGVVKNITAFGAFVDLGGVDGLLHKTDMAWKRINHPSEIVSIGEEIEVQVIAIAKESEKISLGLKQKTDDPWENVEEKYAIGSRVSGTVVNIVNYGVFVQLEEAVEGLIHVSEMAWTRRNVAPSRIVSKGDEIEAIVLEISKEDKRISLGIKQLQPNPWELLEQRFPVGTKITGRIRNLTNFGAFVEIEEGIDGLIHTSDLSWTDRGSNPQEVLKEGEEVEVVVLQIDASERRVSLGLKQTQPDPWDEVPEKYKVGSVVRGKIVNLTSFGAFTKLEEGIDGLIHISEIADRRIERPEEVVSVGDELDVKVINLDPKGRRIGLSLKAAIADQERASMPQEQQQERQERPRRERSSAPRREPRRSKPVEEEETMMGALLKQEMGKNNVENLISSQEVETPEDSQETNSPENAQEVEPSEDTQEVETPEDTQEVEPSEDTQEVETPEDTQEVEPSEDTQEVETPEDAQEVETPEDSQETDSPENAQEPETSEDSQETDSSENPEDSKEPDNSENPEN